MKNSCLILVLSFLVASAHAQKDFTGILKYRMSVVGDSSGRVDSMKLVVGKSKIKIVLYIPSKSNPLLADEQVFIDDLEAQTATILDFEQAGYRQSPLQANGEFEFVSTNQYDAVNRKLCIRYETSKKATLRSGVQKASCLVGIDFMKPTIKTYFFLGVQPFVVDNRLVLDYTLTLSNGQKQRTALYEFQPLEEVDVMFSLEGLKALK